MRKRSCSFMGVLAVGALAVGVSVYAAPRADGTARGKSDASRLVTGASQHLQAVVDGGVAGTAPYVAMTPDYPGLSGANIRMHFQYRLGGWGAAGNLQTYQIAVDQSLFPGDATGAPLTKPVVACAVNADCVAAFGTGSKCSLGVCDVAYQNGADPNFAVNEINACSQITLTCGSTILNTAGSADDGRNWYAGELVLDLNGGKGTYNVCPLSTSATFFVLDSGPIEIVNFDCATVTVPVGRCCILPAGCSDNVTKAECDVLGGLHQPGSQTCADPCAECVTNADCDDKDACTTESCNTTTNFCVRGLIAGFNPATQCCKAGNIAAKADSDDCTSDSCDGTVPVGGACANRPASSCGAPLHVPSPAGTDCDDGNACTYDDVCDGASSSADGGCAGLDANDVPCTDSADCEAVTGGALECQETGYCYCTLSPDLTVVIDGSDAVDPNCFDDGEKVTATAHIGASLDTVVGGELAVVYDPSCLSLNNVILLEPFNNILFMDANTAGEIYIAVGIDLGGTGISGGNFDLVAFSFTKLGGCAGCSICFTDENPRHTRLTTDAGQVVTLVPQCSKEVHGDGVLTMDTPDGGKYNAECDSPARTVTWPAPTANDTCGLSEFWCGGLWQNPYTGAVSDVSTIGVDPYSGGRFPLGAATFCCNAANDCGEAQRECWTVEINDETTLDVDLQLSPTMAGQPGDDALTRCIKFEVFSNCTQAPLVFSETVSFGGLFDLVGKVNTSVKIPSAGQFGCITARDQLHTLRSCYTFGAGDCDANGTLHATFKGDPFFGGNWLIGGNLDGFKKDSATASLNAIDITDFGMFVSDYPNDYGTGNTDCNTEGPHADINGDGLVDLLDFTFISMNFLEDSKDCCCPGSAAEAAAPRGRTSISVRELRANGQAEAAVADLDGNGFVDMDDITAFLNGQTPVKKGQVRSRTGALR